MSTEVQHKAGEEKKRGTSSEKKRNGSTSRRKVRCTSCCTPLLSRRGVVNRSKGPFQRKHVGGNERPTPNRRKVGIT